jgi:hypothetical protein
MRKLPDAETAGEGVQVDLEIGVREFELHVQLAGQIFAAFVALFSEALIEIEQEWRAEIVTYLDGEYMRTGP